MNEIKNISIEGIKYSGTEKHADLIVKSIKPIPEDEELPITKLLYLPIHIEFENDDEKTWVIPISEDCGELRLRDICE